MLGLMALDLVTGVVGSSSSTSMGLNCAIGGMLAAGGGKFVAGGGGGVFAAKGGGTLG